MTFSPWARPTVVVDLPSPSGVGVIAVTTTYLPRRCSASTRRMPSMVTFAFVDPYSSISSSRSPSSCAMSAMGRGRTERAMSRSDGTAIQWVSGAAVARERVPGGIRPEAWPRAASIRWRSRIALVSGPTPPGTGRDRRRDLGRRREVHVAGQLPVDDVDADIDDDRARLEHLTRDEPRAPDGDHDHVGGAGDRREVARVRVADRDRRVLAEEQERGGLADDVGPADDDGVPALELDAAEGEDLDRGVGGRRQEARRSRATGGRRSPGGCRRCPCSGSRLSMTVRSGIARAGAASG